MWLLLHRTVELTSQRFASVQSHPQRSRRSSTHRIKTIADLELGISPMSRHFTFVALTEEGALLNTTVGGLHQ